MNNRLAQIVRNVHATLLGERPQERPPPVGNAVPPPLVYRFPVKLPVTDKEGQLSCEDCPAAKLLDEVRMSIHDAIIRKDIGLVNPEKFAGDMADTIRENSDCCQQEGLMDSEDNRDPYNIECGARLRLARECLGYNRRAFARITLAEDDDQASIKRAEDRLEKWEAGKVRVPTSYVRKLKPRFGVDLNYIFDADMSGMPGDLRTKIIEAEQ